MTPAKAKLLWLNDIKDRETCDRAAKEAAIHYADGRGRENTKDHHRSSGEGNVSVVEVPRKKTPMTLNALRLYPY